MGGRGGGGAGGVGNVKGAALRFRARSPVVGGGEGVVSPILSFCCCEVHVA